jgi:putative transposase
MTSLPNLKAGDRLYIDERDFEFLNVVMPEGADAEPVLQFRDALNHAIRLCPLSEFEQLYLEGKLVWRSRGGRTVEEPPEEPCEAAERCGGCPRCADRRLRANRLHLLRAFDANPVPKTDVALQVFLEGQTPNLPFTGTKVPRAGTFRRMLRDRGEPGDRRRRDMGDRLRRGPRKPRIHEEAERVLWLEAEPYWTNVKVGAKDIHASVHTRLVALNRERAEKGLVAIDIPSRTTVWRLLTQHCDYDHTRMRYGAREARRRFQALRGRQEAKRILDLAIFDHTWVDCFVVDDVDYAPVGRPYLTFCIDVRSRYPLGYVVSFTPPSVETVMACLRRVVRPKTRYPALREWVAFGVPRTVLVDNGFEFVGGSFKDACEDAGMSVEWAPVKTPQYKGVQERFFGTLNSLLFHKLQGAVPFKPHLLKEYGIDPEAKAVLLLSELDELIHHAITEVYGREFHSGIRAVPEQVWRVDAERHNIDYAHDLKALDRSLAKLGPVRTLSRKGIEWLGLTYCSEAVSDLLSDLVPRAKKRGKATGTAPVKFKYWPEDISSISVWNEVRGTYVEVPCADEAYVRNGLSEHVHNAIRRFAEMNALAFSSLDDRCKARALMNERMRSFVNNRLIGTRKAAARLQPRSYDDDQVGAPTSAPLTVIETLSNRQDGDQPDRQPTRARKRKPRKPPRQDVAAVVQSDPRAQGEDAFADTNWNEYLDEDEAA